MFGPWGRSSFLELALPRLLSCLIPVPIVSTLGIFLAVLSILTCPILRLVSTVPLSPLSSALAHGALREGRFSGLGTTARQPSHEGHGKGLEHTCLISPEDDQQGLDPRAGEHLLKAAASVRARGQKRTTGMHCVFWPKQQPALHRGTGCSP